MTTDKEIMPKFDIGDMVIDNVENRKWLITFIYTPWVDGIYAGVYSSLKFRFPEETFFYTLRLSRGKRERVAPEGMLCSAI